MSVLARLAQRAFGAPAPVRARLGGRFDVMGPVIDPEGPPEEVALPMTRAPTAVVGWDADPREQGITDPPHREVPAEPRQPAMARSSDVATAQTAIGEQVEALIRATAAIEQPGSGIGRRDDVVAIDRREDVAASRVAATGAIPPEPFRPLLPPVDAPALAAGPRPPGPSASRAAAADSRDIRISIGRIEVRGEPARRGPPTPAAPPPSRLMSLEDYLGKARRR